MTEAAETDEVMESLLGRTIIGWGQDETMCHLILDDGRVLVFHGFPKERSVH
jgi:hypothetical protein